MTSTSTSTQTVTATDKDGDWTGDVLHVFQDGSVLARVTQAPAKMARWIGSQIQFAVYEVTSL